MRYAYGVTMALLLGGTAFSLATGQAGAQVPQNAPGTSSLAPRPGAPMSFADLVAKLQPAVVNISTKQRVPVRQQQDPLEQFFRQFDPSQGGGQGSNDNGGSGSSGGQGRTREAGSLGSGFIISPDGYIVTNNHLIAGLTGSGTVDTVTVTTTDRKEYPARIVGRDDTSDLALLKIEARGLPFVRWGDSTKARVGDWVIAIGDPYGVGSTVTAGIISALHRSITNTGAYDRYIQTDAAINMGNSGGPMFDLEGNVIGINSALISPTGASVGIGLAIPAELAKPVIDSLMKGQRPQRGYLGVGLQALDEDLAPTLGLPKDSGEIVRTVVPNGPGARGGLVQGDVIVKVNGQQVTPDQTVSYLIANTPVGSRVPLEIIRGGKRATVTVQVGERPTEEALAKISGGGAGDQGDSSTSPTTPQRTLGLSLTTLTPDLARAANLPSTVRGVIITAVDPNANAAEQGLQRGDLIMSVNNQPVSNPAQVIAAVDTARRAGRSSVLLLVKRGNSTEAFVAIDISGK
ncbi:MAG: Do family serine endopeptidase [Sphingomonas sp.]|nr:Do family serine endopeptidase [Sphingomonas sp.]MBW0006854.1 Do family serine endopeptidase [Sphingomonas sp.]